MYQCLQADTGCVPAAPCSAGGRGPTDIKLDMTGCPIRRAGGQGAKQGAVAEDGMEPQ